MRSVEDHRPAEFTHDLEPAHIHHQVVVAERRSALSEQDLLLPVETTFSAALRMSCGETNCPFLMFTVRPVRPAASSRSVWRHKKAGIWRMSAASATFQPAMVRECR